MSADTGGAAFSSVVKLTTDHRDFPDYEVDSAPGMSLRDYFAAHAPPMPVDWPALDKDERGTSAGQVRLHARWAWAYASAMISGRELL